MCLLYCEGQLLLSSSYVTWRSHTARMLKLSLNEQNASDVCPAFEEQFTQLTIYLDILPFKFDVAKLKFICCELAPSDICRGIRCQFSAINRRPEARTVRRAQVHSFLITTGFFTLIILLFKFFTTHNSIFLVTPEGLTNTCIEAFGSHMSPKGSYMLTRFKVNNVAYGRQTVNITRPYV